MENISEKRCCSLRTFILFPMFLKDLYSRHVKTRLCLERLIVNLILFNIQILNKVCSTELSKCFDIIRINLLSSFLSLLRSLGLSFFFFFFGPILEIVKEFEVPIPQHNRYLLHKPPFGNRA